MQLIAERFLLADKRLQRNANNSKMWKLFGAETDGIINELNEVLAA